MAAISFEPGEPNICTVGLALDTIQAMVSRGLDLREYRVSICTDDYTQKQFTLLTIAVLSGQLDIVRLLSEYGCECDALTSEDLREGVLRFFLSVHVSAP